MANPTPDVPIGRIVGLFGLRGELKCDPSPAGRTVFSVGADVQCVCDGRSETVRIESLREHKGRLLIRLRGAQDATGAQRYVGATLSADRSRIELASDEYLDEDLVGCTVRDAEGAVHGRVERVEHFPASDMLIVNRRMLPMVREFVRSIDVHTREIIVAVPPGLLDDDSV